MRTGYLKVQRLTPVLGVVVVGGSLVAAATYFQLDRKVRAEEAFTEKLTSLWQEQKLKMALKSLQGSDLEGVAQHLDALLCRNVLQLNSELASADAEIQAFVEETRRQMALRGLGKVGGEVAGSGR